jgi:hypothetical protein
MYESIQKLASFSKPLESRERINPVPRHLQRQPTQEKGMIRGVSFLDTPNDEPAAPQDAEARRRALPKHMTVGEFEDITNDIDRLKEALFVRTCFIGGVIIALVIIVAGRLL